MHKRQRKLRRQRNGWVKKSRPRGGPLYVWGWSKPINNNRETCYGNISYSDQGERFRVVILGEYPKVVYNVPFPSPFIVLPWWDFENDDERRRRADGCFEGVYTPY